MPDIVKDLIFFIIVVGAAFGWSVLCLLIISFIALSYLHFTFEGILIASGIIAAVVAVFYLIGIVRKYHKQDK